MKSELDRRLSDREQKLKALGPARETDAQQRSFLIDLATQFQETTSQALDAYYNRNALFEENTSLRLATSIVDLNTEFSDNVWLKGHTMLFSSSATRNDGETELPFASLDRWKSGEQGLSKEYGSEQDRKYPEISEVLQPPWSCPDPANDNIFDCIELKYKKSRGFELGTFDPCLLPIIFQMQSTKWERLAKSYISDVILLVHSFASELLSALCPDPHVRSNLWSLMSDELLSCYQKAINHTEFILRVERQGTLLTTNHYFNDNLQKARAERLKSSVKNQTISAKIDGMWQDVTKKDSIVQSVQMGNIQHTVEDIHAILKSYYKVARKRFVDVVCMQAADHILVTGPDSPLRLFTPSYVHHLSLDSLRLVAGEEVISKRTRKTLEDEIESLKAGKKVLRG